MKKHIYILLLALVFLLLSCGVKKHAAETSAVAAEPVVETASTDTLPEFLKEFANDSTIHINWAYGIPFIIDDSVPMLLPPIDKNPEGYVIRPIKVDQYNRLLVPKSESAVFLDSLLWLNKCINETKEYLLTNPEIAALKHDYRYILHLLQNQKQKIFWVRVIQEPAWQCYPEIMYRTNYNYYFDLQGNLLGKVARAIPYRLFYKNEYQYPMQVKIPDSSALEKIILEIFLQRSILINFSMYIGEPCSMDGDVVPPISL